MAKRDMENRRRKGIIMSKDVWSNLEDAIKSARKRGFCVVVEHAKGRFDIEVNGTTTCLLIFLDDTIAYINTL